MSFRNPGRGSWVTVKHMDSGQLDPRANASATLYTLDDLGQLVLGSIFPF